MGKLNLIVCDITDERLLKQCDAIVNPTNPMMRMGMGVSMTLWL